MIQQTQFPIKSIKHKNSSFGLIVLISGFIIAGGLIGFNYMYNQIKNKNVVS